MSDSTKHEVVGDRSGANYLTYHDIYGPVWLYLTLKFGDLLYWLKDLIPSTQWGCQPATFAFSTPTLSMNTKSCIGPHHIQTRYNTVRVMY